MIRDGRGITELLFLSVKEYKDIFFHGWTHAPHPHKLGASPAALARSGVCDYMALYEASQKNYFSASDNPGVRSFCLA